MHNEKIWQIFNEDSKGIKNSDKATISTVYWKSNRNSWVQLGAFCFVNRNYKQCKTGSNTKFFGSLIFNFSMKNIMIS